MARPFVYYFIRIITPIIFLFQLSTTISQAETKKTDSVIPVTQQNLVKVGPNPADFFTKKKMEMIKELDEVMREMIWLIRSQRPAANKTLFGKVWRALQQAKGVKLTEKSKHTCDQYSLEKVTEYQYRVYEHCQKHRNPDLLAIIEWSHARAKFQFHGQNYADVLGLAASLVAPLVDCIVDFSGDSKLVGMSCTGFRITREDNVIRFESLVHNKGKDPLMQMKGEVLKNLLPYSDLSIIVPLTGKVKIVEKKKVPDIDETTPEQKAKDLAKDRATEEAKRNPNPQPTLAPVPKPIDPRKPDPPQNGEAPVDPTQPPRDSEVDQQNNDLIKNSPPDVIEIKEPVPTR